MAEMELFDQYQLHKQFLTLWEENKTGVLNCEIQGYNKSLYWRDGAAVFASSNDPEDKLPQVLIRMGHFTEDQYESVAPNFKEELSVGRNLVEMGLITQQELVNGAKRQVYEISTRILNSEEGQAGFEEGDLPQGIVSLPLVFPRDLMRGLLEMQDKAWIGDRFKSGLDFVCAPNPDKPIDFSQMDVADHAAETYALIDGERDFNHLVFEAGIDDFELMKFIYALELMGFITMDGETSPDESPDPMEDTGEVTPDPALDETGEIPVPDEVEEEEEPIPDLGDVADQLGDALATDEQINQLNMPVPDETIDLDRNNLAAQMPLGMDPAMGMDATMELDKAGMGLEQALAEGEAPEHAIFEEEPEEEDDAEEEQEPEEEEEAGLDNLDEMDGDILEQELAKMQAPLDDDDELAAFEDHDEEGEDEDEQDEEDEDNGEGKKSLLPKLALALIVAGLLIIGGTYSLRFLDDGIPELTDEELAQLTPENDGEEPDQPIEESPDNADEAIEDQTLPEDNKNLTADTAPEPETDDRPIVVNQPAEEKDPVVPEEEKADPVVPEEEITELSSEELTPDEPRETENDSEPPSTVGDPERQTQMTRQSPADSRGFHSPVADGWDNKQPQGESLTTRVATLPPPEERSTDQAVDQPGTRPEVEVRNETQPKPEIISEPPAEKPVEPTVETQPKPETDTRPQPVSTGDPDAVKRARSLMASGNYAAAAEAFEEAMKDKARKRTVMLFLACKTDSIDKVVARFGNADELFILPKNLSGKACYWVCWDSFDSRLDALKTIDDLPAEMEKQKMDVKRIGELK